MTTFSVIGKLILLDGSNRPGGNIMTVSVIVIMMAGGMKYSIMRVCVNVDKKEKLPHLVVRAHDERLGNR